MYQTYNTPPPLSYIFPATSGIVLTGIIFTLTYTYTEYLHHIHIYTPFSATFPPPTGTNTPPHTSRQDLLCPPVLQFYRRKKENKRKMTFLLV
jgi:hypothetical protein